MAINNRTCSVRLVSFVFPLCRCVDLPLDEIRVEHVRIVECLVVVAGHFIHEVERFNILRGKRYRAISFYS
jgi:hypothetical protein